MKYKNWLLEWIDNFVSPSVKCRTYLRYSQAIYLHIIPALGEIDIKCLSLTILQKFVTQLLSSGNCKTNNGLSANTVNMIISILQSSLKTAYQAGLVSDYQANRIKRPKMREKQIECFTLAEQKKIEYAVLNSSKDKHFGILLCLYTGLRLGELLALTWQDIDLKKGILQVSKTCYDTKVGSSYRRVTDKPKTATSNRIIPLPKQLLPLLRGVKKRSDSEYVVSGTAKQDTPLFVRSYQRSFSLLLKSLDIPHKGFHSLRHTFATRAIECGMDVKTLSEILGHKNPTVTLNRYAHSLLEHKADMMNRVGRLL